MRFQRGDLGTRLGKGTLGLLLLHAQFQHVLVGAGDGTLAGIEQAARLRELLGETLRRAGQLPVQLPAGGVGHATMAQAGIALARHAVVVALQLLDPVATLFAVARPQLIEFALMLF